MNKEGKMDLEQIREGKNKRQKITILILCILTVLIALMGVTFAYFTSSINNLKGNQSLVIGTTTLEAASFQASDPLALIEAKPGSSVENTFTITNPNSSATVRYTLKFIADVNNFTNVDGDGQLLIKISGGGIDGEKVLDFTDGENAKESIIVSNTDLEARESDVYKLRVEFVDIGTVQDSNLAKNFAGHIEIIQTIYVNQ